MFYLSASVAYAFWGKQDNIFSILGTCEVRASIVVPTVKSRYNVYIYLGMVIVSTIRETNLRQFFLIATDLCILTESDVANMFSSQPRFPSSFLGRIH